MQDAKQRERAHQTYVNCWEGHLCLGHQRSKIVLHFQPPKPNTYLSGVVVHKFFGWRPPWMILESSSNKCHCYVTIRVLSSSPTIQFNMQEQSILMSATILLEIINKRGHFNWEYGHRRSTCRYIHQATWWEEILQAKKWIEYIGFLKYVLMHPHLYDMPLLWAKQGKIDCHDIYSLLRTCLVHLVIPIMS
jgi:hypothetical protein